MALKKGNLDLLVMILIPIFIGLGFVALTIWSVTQIRARENLHSATTGIVTALKRSPHFGDQSKAAYVTFVDQRGQQHTFLTKSRSNPSRYAVGQTVTVLYEPTSQAKDLNASIDSFSESWMDPIGSGLIAGGFLIGGLGFLIVAWPQLTRARRKRKRRQPKPS